MKFAAIKEETMKSSALTDPAFSELDYRENDRIEVSLLWSSSDGRIVVVVVDAKADAVLEFAVEPHRAADAFRHPFAYAPQHVELALAHH